MKITSTSPPTPPTSLTPPPNLPALKQEFKIKVNHLSQILNTLLQSPDKLNSSLCQDVSTSVLHLNQLLDSIAQADPQGDLGEAASIISNVLKAPVYV